MARMTFIKSGTKNKLAKEIEFEFYAPASEEVRLAGNFNNWDASKQRLKKDASGHWRAKLELKPGRYEYRYVVDGNWERDQRQTVAVVPNAFGTWNSVIEVA